MEHAHTGADSATSIWTSRVLTSLATSAEASWSNASLPFIPSTAAASACWCAARLAAAARKLARRAGVNDEEKLVQVDRVVASLRKYLRFERFEIALALASPVWRPPCRTVSTVSTKDSHRAREGLSL